MYWSGPFACHCECGWVSGWKKNPVAAQFAGEYHTQNGNCSFYREALSAIAEGKMVMADRSKYFPKAEFLGPGDVKNGQKLLIEKFEEIQTRIGTRPVLRVKGFEKPLGLNATNFDVLVEKFGDDDKKWAGKQVTVSIVQVNNPQTKKMQPGLRLA